MNICNFTETTISFFKSHFLRMRSPEEKKVGIVALAILLVGFLLVGISYYFLSRKILQARLSTGNSKPQDRVIHNVYQSQKGEKMDIMRVMYQGRDHIGNKLTQARLLDLVKEFEQYQLDPKSQEEYNNQEKDLVYIDVNDFGKKNNVDQPNLEAFLRYLVCIGKVFAYSRARVGYCVYLNQEIAFSKTENKKYTKQELGKIDSYMQSLVLPSLDRFSDAEKPIVKKINEQITSAHYQHASQDYKNSVKFYDIPSHNQVTYGVLDKLVRQQTIHSWNSYQINGNIVAKLNENDPCNPLDCMQRENWRDIQQIEQEERFKKENHLSVDPQFLNQSSLNDKEKPLLGALITELNQRTKSGPYRWRGTYLGIKALDFLKAQGLIHDYQAIGFQFDYDIFVKQADRKQQTS